MHARCDLEVQRHPRWPQHWVWHTSAAYGCCEGAREGVRWLERDAVRPAQPLPWSSKAPELPAQGEHPAHLAIHDAVPPALSVRAFDDVRRLLLSWETLPPEKPERVHWGWIWALWLLRTWLAAHPEEQRPHWYTNLVPPLRRWYLYLLEQTPWRNHPDLYALARAQGVRVLSAAERREALCLEAAPTDAESEWWAVPFEEVPELVGQRQVLLRAGEAWAPARRLLRPWLLRQLLGAFERLWHNDALWRERAAVVAPYPTWRLLQRSCLPRLLKQLAPEAPVRDLVSMERVPECVKQVWTLPFKWAHRQRELVWPLMIRLGLDAEAQRRWVQPRLPAFYPRPEQALREWTGEFRSWQRRLARQPEHPGHSCRHWHEQGKGKCFLYY